MNYARFFAAQSTLTDFTKKFASNKGGAKSEVEKEAMMGEILNYLDQDLGKLFDVKIPNHKMTNRKRHQSTINNSP